MSGPIFRHELPTVGNLALNQEQARTPFLIRTWVKCTSPTPYIGNSSIHIWLHLMVSILLIGQHLYSHWVIGHTPRGLESYRTPPFGAAPLGLWKRESSLGFSGPVAPTGKRLQPNWTATGSNWTSSCSWGPEFH